MSFNSMNESLSLLVWDTACGDTGRHSNSPTMNRPVPSAITLRPPREWALTARRPRARTGHTGAPRTKALCEDMTAAIGG